MNLEWKDWYWALAFGTPALGMLTGYFSPVNKKIQTPVLPVRPPPWVFMVAWFILYTMIGFAWVFMMIENDNPPMSVRETELLYRDYVWIIYPVLLVILFTWPWVFNKNPKYGMYHLVVAIVATLVTFSVSPSISKVLLSFLLGWLYFAGMMNYTIVLKK